MKVEYHDQPFHPLVEQIVEVICEKTQNANPQFFRLLVNYHLTKMASMMRVGLKTLDRGLIPVNMYAVNLAPSGLGKGHSTNIIEEMLLHKFRETFFQYTYPEVEEENLAKLAVKRADLKGEDPDDELKRVQAQSKDLGTLLFAFDSATAPAIKQTRSKLLMSGIGSMNLEIDEVGRNLSGNDDALTTMLELYDKGRVKPKLTKNTNESKHTEDMDGSTPANVLMFGAPCALFDGGKIEDAWYAYLSSGGARRSFFGLTNNAVRNLSASAEDIFDSLIDKSKSDFFVKLSLQFERLAHRLNFEKAIDVPRAIGIKLIEYKKYCETLAAKLPEHEDMAKAELSHRYFKALKLAGTYAFIDGTSAVTEQQLFAAIRLAEESGIAFERIKKRDPSHVKLAKYIADVGYEVTHVQIAENLPFYRGSKSAREEMINYAIAWGYKNQVIIKRSYSNGIDFFQGETLKPTDMSKLRLSYSNHVAYDYKNVEAPFADLHKLVQAPDLHWINHHVVGGHRRGENIMPGFNMVVLDVDGGCSVAFAKDLMKNYSGLIYTTKRHTPQDNRFRLILPLNFYLKLGPDDYREFMSNIMDWVPFDVDKSTGQRSKKWLTQPGQFLYLPGEQLVDAMDFIPRTTRNDERKKELSAQSLTNLERWFIQNTGSGNRSNQMIKYALMLVDQGKDFDEIRSAVYGLNSKLQDRLNEDEIKQTILVTASRALKKRNP